MNPSRRDLPFFLALAASAAKAAEKPALPSKVYDFTQLPVKTKDTSRGRAIFDGATASGCPVEMHCTELAPGAEPHPAHHHLHDELVILREGQLDVTVNGHTTTIGPGSVAYFHSGDHHGMRNSGTIWAQYYVVALGAKG